MSDRPVETVPVAWYGCIVCGELRRYPFEANADRPGCRCLPAANVANGAGTGPERPTEQPRVRSTLR